MTWAIAAPSLLVCQLQSTVEELVFLTDMIVFIYWLCGRLCGGKGCGCGKNRGIVLNHAVISRSLRQGQARQE